MSNDEKFDDLERRIVEVMATNGRMSPVEIAERIGNVSERTVRNRLNSLIEKKLLYMAAIPDPRAYGEVVNAELRLTLEPALAMAAADRVVDHPLVDWVGYRGGDCDLAASLIACDAETVSGIVEDFSLIPGVQSVRVITYLNVLKAYGFRLQAADELRARLHSKQNQEPHLKAVES